MRNGAAPHIRLSFWSACLSVCVATCLAASVSAADPAPATPRLAERLAAGQPVKVVCLGDSVTGVYYHTGGRRAYPEMLAVALQKAAPQARITLVNAGISGNTTVDGLNRLQKDVLDQHPDVVTVMFGLNDMVRVPLTDYQANLKTIIEKCRAVGAEVLLCTPNAVLDTAGRPITKLQEYCRAMHEVGAALKVPVCDCYAAHTALRERDALAWRLTLSDAIHPNMDGHKLTAVALTRTLTGRDVSLADVAPLQPALVRTRARVRAGEALRILAMPPYDRMLGEAFRTVSPNTKTEITLWPTADQTLAQLEEQAKTVRGKGYDLVVLAIPAAVTPHLESPPEAAISSYSWILNWSLSFGLQEWDVVGIAPGVTTIPETPADQAADAFARHMFGAQDLTLLTRPKADRTDATTLCSQWLKAQLDAP
ncbi:MAG: hypothetical protein JSS02_13685 [Planctomycetes bacterium]|nr:hypothetical protein [Planctomycetota bacterium]